MTRLSLVGFLCLCLQVNALSAPFVHLHADARHETDHHGGRAVHRHLAAHASAADHHHDELDDRISLAHEDVPSVEVSAEPSAVAVNVMSARLTASRVLHLTVPALVASVAEPPRPVKPPDDDVGQRLVRPPDLGTSSLRGPPR